MAPSERNTVAFTDYIDPDGLLAVAAAENVQAVFITGRPVVEPSKLGKHKQDPLFYQRRVSNERHLFNATRFANDLHSAGVTDVPVFLGLELGDPHAPVWGEYEYDGVVVPRTPLRTTIPHSMHLNEYKHPLVPAPGGLVQPGTFREGLDHVLSLQEGFDTLLCGPATEFAVLANILQAKDVAHRMGFLAVQGDFMSLHEESLIFRAPFNYGCDPYAGDYVQWYYPGPMCSVRSQITRDPGVSFGGDPADDYYEPGLPAVDWAAKEDKALEAMLAALGGDDLPPVFRRVYEVHRRESWTARFQGKPMGRPPAAPHDLHLAMLMQQWRRGEDSPYSLRPVSRAEVSADGPRYDVTAVDSIAFFAVARAALTRKLSP